MKGQHSLKPVPKLDALDRAQIEKFSHDGRGLARIDGKTVFIEGALPEEQVVFKYTKIKRDYAEGRVVEVLNPSSHRAKPKCPHYDSCGGCALQHLDEESQIQVKEGLLVDLLKRISHIEVSSLLPPIRANAWHYRHKARLSVRYVAKKNKVLIGFREKFNPRHLAQIDDCYILNQAISDALPDLADLINSLEEKKSMAQIEVAVGDDKAALIFRNLDPLPQSDIEKICSFGKKKDFVLFLQPKGPQSVKQIYPNTRDDYLQYALPKEGIHYKFHPTDFTQINPEMNRFMIAKALELLDLQVEDTVLDLFCGLGNFSLPFAKRCAKVIGIEGSEEMVLRANMNAKLNHITNATFYAADLSKPNALEAIVTEPISKILLDPPRTGAVEIIHESNKLKARCIVYVSCNPATFARDAGILVNTYGYRLKTVGVMDMFPHTNHVESIALFEKG